MKIQPSGMENDGNGIKKKPLPKGANPNLHKRSADKMPIITSTTLIIKDASTSHSQPFPERLSQSVQWQKWTKNHIVLEIPKIIIQKLLGFPAEHKIFASIDLQIISRRPFLHASKHSA